MFAIKPSGVPLWKQVESGVREMIANRKLRPGDVVPSVRELGKTLSVAPNTVQRAYRHLINAGILVVRRGKQTVVGHIPEVMRGSARELALEKAALQYAAHANAVGAPLDEAVDELVAAYRRLDDNNDTSAVC